MIRSGKLRVWTLAWNDLDEAPSTPLNPLAESSLGAEKIGRLGRVLAHPDFAPAAEAVKAFQTDTALEAFRRMLDGQTQDVDTAHSVLVRGLVAMGRGLDDLPRAAALSTEARLFLEAPGLTEHAGAGALDLYLACEKISPAQWLANSQDLRVLLRAELPAPGATPTAKLSYSEAWRGLWRVVNLFQGLRGFHVEIEGLDTLSPPDTSAPAPDGGPLADVWAETRVLCDEAFHPLIDALIAAEAPGPDHIGDDLLAAGRVVGMMEFGWSAARVAVCEEDHEGTEWTLITFTPGADPVGEAVTGILQALEGPQS